MDLQAFRREAHGLVDWMTDYLAGVERYPVRAQVEPGAIAAQLPAAAPNQAAWQLIQETARGLATA